MEPWSIKVQEYIRKQKWQNQKTKRTALQFGSGDDIVGYAVVGHAQAEHPDNDSLDKAIYLIVYVMGVDSKFQGRKNPLSPTGESYASNLLRALEEKIAPTHPMCIGMYLMVNDTNARGIRLYERAGFVFDTSSKGKIPEKAGHLLIMRKTDWPNCGSTGH